jgi:hypothetical protein
MAWTESYSFFQKSFIVHYIIPLQTIVDILDDPSIGGGIRNVGDIVETFLSLIIGMML